MKRWIVRTVLAVVVVAFAVDASRAADRQWTAAGAIGAIHGYQHTLSPALARLGVACRFTPTCSHYAEAVLRKHGILRGGWLAARRVLRCGPWTPAGTADPPPD